MAYVDLAKSYIVITIIVIVEKRQKVQYILICICNILDIKDSLFFLNLI